MFCKECRHAQAIFPNSAELVCEKIYDKITADNMDGPADNIVVDPDFGCIMYEQRPAEIEVSMMLIGIPISERLSVKLRKLGIKSIKELSNMSWTECGRVFGHKSRNEVANLLHKFGLSFTEKIVISERNYKIFDRYTDGFKVADLAKEYGLSKWRVYQIIHKVKRHLIHQEELNK